MKASIRDAETLNTLSPREVAAYLRSRHWKQFERLGRRGEVWTLEPESGQSFEVLLPLDRALADYTRRMADILSALEKIEERSQLEIFKDVAESTLDIVRIRLAGSDFEDGSIPLETGVRLVEQTQNLVLSAACATVNPQSVYQTRKPPKATDYMKKVRLGQTEYGSFVLTIQSIVPPKLTGQALFSELDEPFERQVILKLATALQATRQAADLASTSADLRPFHDAVPHGISANLCDAIAGLFVGSNAQSLGVSFSWAPVRSLITPIANHVEFSPDVIPVIQEAARIFRDTAPVEDFVLFGPVIKLESENMFEGRATVAGVVEGKVRKVRVDLDKQDYRTAYDAHGKLEVQAIQCVGELVKDGTTYVLHNAHDIRIVNLRGASF